MVLAALAGWCLGTFAGVLLGGFLLGHVFRIKRIDYLTRVDFRADEDDKVPMPQTAGQPVSFFNKELLRDTSPWLVEPDYDRAMFLNNIITQLWPNLSPAIHKEILSQAAAPIKDLCKKVPILKEVRIDRLDLGARPPRIDSFRNIDTPEDELILEVPVFWGGDIRLRATAVLAAGERAIDIPVDVNNIQVKILARITVKPLVERLPCVGGVTVSLMETPHINFDLRLADSPDIMALPGIPAALSAALHVAAGRMLVYPNAFELPLMPNFGLPPPPLGMLHVRVLSAAGLSGSILNKMTPYVELEVRRGRPLFTRTLPSAKSYSWDEAVDLVVDDPARQHLKVRFFDADMLSPTLVGQAALPLKGAGFMSKPGVPVSLTVQMRKPIKKFKKPSKLVAEAAAGTAEGAVTPKGSAGAPASPTTSGGSGGSGGKANGGRAQSPGASAGAASQSASRKPVSPVSPKPKKGFFRRLLPHRHKKHSIGEEGKAATGRAGSPSTPASPSSVEATPRGSTAAATATTRLAAAAPAPPASSPAGTSAGPSTPATVAAPGATGSPAPASATTAAPLPLPQDAEEQELAIAAAAALTGATLQLEVTFLPFKSAQAEMVKPPTGQAGETTEPAAAVITSVRRTLARMPSKKKGSAGDGSSPKGVLTLFLKKVTNLAVATDTYCTVTLYDPHRKPEPKMEFRTSVVLNEHGPRYNFKADFVNVSSNSTVSVVVYDQPGLLESIGSLKLPGMSKAAKPLGKLRIPVADVAVEGRIKDVYPLAEAETGEADLTLEWTPIELLEHGSGGDGGDGTLRGQ